MTFHETQNKHIEKKKKKKRETSLNDEMIS